MDSGNIEPACSAHLMFAVNMIYITIRVFSNPFPGDFDHIFSFPKTQGFHGAGLNASGQLPFDHPRMTHGAFSNPGRQRLVIFIGGYFKWAGDHTIPAPHTDGGIVNDSAGFGLCKRPYETSGRTCRLQAVIALFFIKYGMSRFFRICHICLQPYTFCGGPACCFQDGKIRKRPIRLGKSFTLLHAASQVRHPIHSVLSNNIAKLSG